MSRGLIRLPLTLCVSVLLLPCWLGLVDEEVEGVDFFEVDLFMGLFRSGEALDLDIVAKEWKR
jgi:hypothetical protein